MLKYVLAYFSLVVFFLLQTTLGIYIDIYNIAPNIIFVFAVCYAMYNFPVKSAVLCAVAGFVVDLYQGSYIGLNTLLYMYIGLAISNFAAILIKKNIWTVALGVFVISLLYQTVILIVNYVALGYSGFFYPFGRIVFPGAVYDAVLSFIMAFWARWLSEDRIRGL